MNMLPFLNRLSKKLLASFSPLFHCAMVCKWGVCKTVPSCPPLWLTYAHCKLARLRNNGRQYFISVVRTIQIKCWSWNIYSYARCNQYMIMGSPFDVSSLTFLTICTYLYIRKFEFRAERESCGLRMFCLGLLRVFSNSPPGFILLRKTIFSTFCNSYAYKFTNVFVPHFKGLVSWNLLNHSMSRWLD
jgi:hypothetical protein